MTTLVTGARGMIGTAVMLALQAGGRDGRVLDRSASGRPWRLGDLVDHSLLSGASSLIHLAWDLDPDHASTCVTGSLRLFEQCREAGIGRIVFVSSQSAGARKPTRYGAAKRQVEVALEGDGGALAVRPGLVWSDPPQGTFGRLVGTRVLGWTIVASTPEVLHPVHVDDLAAILAKASAAPQPVGVLEVGQVQPLSARALVTAAVGPGHQIRVPQAATGLIAALLSVGGSRGRILADRARGLAVLEPMHDPTMTALGISCRPLTRLGDAHGR